MTKKRGAVWLNKKFFYIKNYLYFCKKIFVINLLNCVVMEARNRYVVKLGTYVGSRELVVKLFESINRNIITFNDVFKYIKVTLREIYTMGEGYKRLVNSIIIEYINDYLEFENRQRTMTDKNVKDTAFLIMTEYGQHLQLEDLALAFRMMKLGKLGELYDLNGRAIIKFIEKYLQIKERSYEYYLKERERREREEERAREEEQIRKERENPQVREQIRERMEQIAKKLAAWNTAKCS